MTAKRALEAARHVLADLGSVTFETPADQRGRTPLRLVRDLADYGRLLRATLADDGLRASVLAERILAAHPDVYVALRASAYNSARRGEISTSLRSTRRLRAISDSRKLRQREADLVERLRETDPAWLPVIPGSPVATSVRAPTAVMHLMKTSLPDRESGYTIRSAATLRAQVEAGLEPFVVTPWGFPPRRADDAAPPASETVDGILHLRLEPGADLRGVPPTTQLSHTAALAAEVVRRERPAIIHAHSGHRGYEYGLVAAALKAHTGRPFVYEVRGFLEASWTSNPTMARDAERAELTQRRLATEARVMAAADGIATLGLAMRDELVARGVPAEKVELVPNGIDPTEFAPIPRDMDLARRLGLDGKWVFGYISNIDHFREGQALLIEAAGRLIADGRAVACLIVGDGHLREALEAQVARAGLQGSVVFTGRVPHDMVRDHYALLDAFVVPRVPDRAARFTTPLKPYEAMALEIPLVVSDLPALIEIAAPDTRGLAFPAGDASALAERLRLLMDRPELASALGRAGREWVIAERTWTANAERYRRLYEAILARYPDGVARSARPG